MPYGTVKVDNVTFTNNSVDATTTFSGIYASITNNLTLSGTATAATFTGTTANFTNVNAQNISVTTSLSGLAITGGTAGFTTITGTTVTGTTANFATLSGTTVTGTTARFITITGGTAGFTTITGTTVTGTTANFVTVSGTTVTGTTASFTSGIFTSLSGTTHTITSGVFALGTAALPSISFVSDPNTGIYSPGADQVAVATNGTGKLFIDSIGNIGVGAASPSAWSYAGNITIPGAGRYIASTADDIRFASNVYSSDVDRYVANGFATRYRMADGTHQWTTAVTGVAGNAITYNESMRITAGGLVGIGSSSPSAKLDVEALNFAGGPVIGVRYNTSNVRLGFNVANSNGFTYIGSNTNNKLSSDSATYDLTGQAASQLRLDGGQLIFNNAPSGTAGNDITFTNRLTITSAGLVGIGTTSVSSKLHVLNPSGGSGTTEVSTIERDNSGYFLKLYRNAGSGNTGGLIGADSAGTYYTGGHNTQNMLYIDAGNSFMSFYTNNAERARIDSSGRLLVGTSTARSNVYQSALNITPQNQIESNKGDYSGGLGLINCSATGQPAVLTFGQSYTNTLGGNALIANNEFFGLINFTGNDGSDFRTGAQISALVDGTPGANDMPGRLVFSTTADGASSPTEAMRINNAGELLVGKTTNLASDNGTIIGGQYFSVASQGFQGTGFHRNGDDGGIIGFFQDGTEEGSISVSGGTVSYNGAHLSRWSQLASGAERIEILRGSVLSNLDEMCEWGEEENEQLNRMKVSDVEGDKNVSGVFQAWDDDDDTYTNDFYCAMTGDFIIRIAEGVTVERGDLLMSAGDGTAKPQDDDIIRSKTIAKVTSTNVSCTYEDGSYCVPCVLMAC
jgi:hypothetical protein